MLVTQVHDLLNTITAEVTGKTDLVMEDLTNVVDVGVEIFDATSVDNFVRTLVDHIGKMVFVDRKYMGRVPSVLMDGWEYGAVLQKVSLDELPNATENETWQLKDGQSYDVNVFYEAKISNKFFSKRVSYEIPMSFVEKQVKSAFNNATQMNAFFSMIYTGIENSMTIKLQSLIMSTINNMTAMSLANADTKPTVAINLLTLYKEENPESTLTAKQAVKDPEFLRFMSYQISMSIDYISDMSVLYNIGGKDRFTPEDKLHLVMLSSVARASEVYLQSDTYHERLLALPNGLETVSFWQGSGKTNAFESVSKINVTPSAPDATPVEKSGIIAVMFDRDALGVANMARRVTANYNAKAEFYNNWFKYDAGYFNDTNENFVVFYVEDAPVATKTRKATK